MHLVALTRLDEHELRLAVQCLTLLLREQVQELAVLDALTVGADDRLQRAVRHDEQDERVRVRVEVALAEVVSNTVDQLHLAEIFLQNHPVVQLVLEDVRDINHIGARADTWAESWLVRAREIS